MVRILGIDPGTAIVGWGVIDHDPQKLSNKVVAYGHIETLSTLSDATRLAEIVSGITDLINTYKPHEAGLETLFYFKNAKTIITVAQARGVILHTCFSHKLVIGEYTPLQIKQSLTGYGRANKSQMQEMIRNVLKLKKVPTPDDTADALAVALCHSNSRKYLQTINFHTYV
jgi:crossover junction endodeoxyribonuclease RuvC